MRQTDTTNGRADETTIRTGQHYSNPQRERDPYALPDLEIFELTAAEVASMDEDTRR